MTPYVVSYKHGLAAVRAEEKAGGDGLEEEVRGPGDHVRLEVLIGFERVGDDDEGVVDHHEHKGDRDADAGFAAMRLNRERNGNEGEREAGEGERELTMNLHADRHVA